MDIVNQTIEKKLIGGVEFFTDFPHVKANSYKKKLKTEVTRKIKERKLGLEKEIKKEREKIGNCLLNTKIKKK